jgi:hypothetical protein
MNTSLIESLKIKKKPHTKQNFYVSIPDIKPDMGIRDDSESFVPPSDIPTQPNIIDKTGSTDFDSSAFLQRIKNRGKITKDVVSKSVVPSTIKQPIIDVSKVIEKQPTCDTTGKPTIISKRRTVIKPSTKKTITEIIKPTTSISSSDTIELTKEFIKQRIDIKPQERIIASEYYLNSREKYINFINALFLPYKAQLEEDEKTLTCESRKGEFSLLTHQKIVRDYINSYTPYRGALLYHGLGSGKTCSSIAIAEGLKTTKEIIIMTPASLRMNYIQELKMCGDLLYKKNQFWEFINTDKDPQLNEVLSKALNIDIKFIQKNKGAWFVDTTKPSNYDSLSSVDKQSLNNQIDIMISSKYRFINYNGLRLSHLNKMSMDGSINPFDNKVIVIDEVHNLISRIVNKLNKSDSLGYRLYKYLMEAKNARLVLLSGTPIINYPNELGILYNILRGYINTYTIQINPTSTRKVDIEFFKFIFKDYGYIDYIDYKSSSKELIVTQNPFGFIQSSNQKVKKDDSSIDYKTFLSNIFKILKQNSIDYNKRPKLTKYKALPDTLDEFKNLFINEDFSIKNETLLKRRVIGLTSYLSDMDALLPQYDIAKNYHEEFIPMSDYQFGIYEIFRQNERKEETRNAKKKKSNINQLYDDAASTYRIFSRLACNFVFPEEFRRPMPSDIKNINENVIDESLPDNLFDEEQEGIRTESSYKENIENALNYIDENKYELLNDSNLINLSPKFLRIIQNIRNAMNDTKTDRLHLIYSQFRTLEGIGIMKYVLEANGFCQFKIKKNEDGLWNIDIKDEDRGKPTFILYTGTETPEEKEILRNIFNSTWGTLPTNLVNQLKEISSNNFYGEIIKLIMITASGAEGISLRNVCYVHLMESYWHPVRLEQVIGRARRICSHQDLPTEQRTVDVYLYLMTFTDKQKSSDSSIELRLKDVSKIDNKTPVTSDEALYEISNIKSQINSNLLTSIKESAFDCVLYNKSSKEKLKCFSFGETTSSNYSFKPSYLSEETDKIKDINKSTLTWKAKVIKKGTTKYAYKQDTQEVYDYDSYVSGNPILVGKLTKKDGKYIIQYNT